MFVAISLRNLYETTTIRTHFQRDESTAIRGCFFLQLQTKRAENRAIEIPESNN